MKKTIVRAHHIPEAIREVIAVHQILRRLGFVPDQIEIQPIDNAVLVILSAQGSNLGMAVKTNDYNPDTFQELWLRAGLLWNDTAEDIRMTDATKDYIIRTSKTMARAPDIIAALMAVGIVIPREATLHQAPGRPAGPVTFLSKGGDA